MKYLKTIKLFRIEKNIKISQMKINNSRLAYSRIEHKQTKLKFNDFIQIINTLEVTPSEFFKFSSYDDSFEKFKILINQCIADTDNLNLKNELLTHYYNPKNIHKKRKVELYYLVAICGNLQEKYEEVSSLNSNEINYIFNKIVTQSFFTEYDYLIGMNITTLLDEKMLDKLVSCMFPIKYKNKRNDLLIKYASLLLLNITSSCIYNQNYKKALFYLNVLKEELKLHDNYYLRLSALYHESIALHFINQDTVYIENARNVIKLIREIGDIQLSRVFEKELNNIIKNPAYYRSLKQSSIVHTRY